MTWTPPLYPRDYSGYRYTNPSVPGPPVTALTMQTAWEEGREACLTRTPGGARPANPYAGLSQSLDAVWQAGYTAADEPRLRRIAEAEDQAGLSASTAPS